jgi:hypothetical protein
VSHLSTIEDTCIDRAGFAEQLREATERALTVAATMVRQRMLTSWRYLIVPEAAGYPPDYAFKSDEQVYSADLLVSGKTLGPFTLEEAVGWLWRDGKVPVWVDVSAYAADRRHTYVRLCPSDRFSGKVRLLKYQRPGDLPPFGIKSPELPSMEWRSPEESGRFDLPGQWPARARRRVWRSVWRAFRWVSAGLGLHD